jgi:arginase family enzyme
LKSVVPNKPPWGWAKKKDSVKMSESLVTQSGAPDTPYCNPETARVTIIPAPLEYSVCYMKGTEHGPQAILDASSQYELLDLFRETNRRSTIVGMDVVELCPMEGQTRADFLAAKLVYKMIGYRFCDKA